MTSDNPRNEDPQTIIDETIPGLGSARYEVLIDRREAIYSTIENALPGDLILIAGKGHETYQEVNGKRQYLDDREVARRALEIRKKTEEVEFAKRQAEREERERKRAKEDGGERHLHQE